MRSSLVTLIVVSAALLAGCGRASNPAALSGAQGASVKQGAPGADASDGARYAREYETTPLGEADVSLYMDIMRAVAEHNTNVAKIKNTSCSFDTSPAALKELKDAGVPDNVILAVVQALKN